MLPAVSPSSRWPYLWMVIGSFFFAVMSSLVHLSSDHCDWQVVAITRAFLAMVIAAAMARWARKPLVFFRPPVLWIRSVAGSVSLICGFYALSLLPVSDVLTLTNMFPLWVAVLSWPLLGRPPQEEVWLAVVCGLVGVAFIQQPQLATGNLAWIVALSDSFTSAVALIGLHHLHHIDARAVVVHFSAVSLLFCIACLFVFPHHTDIWSTLDSTTLLLLLGVGCSATAGQILLTKAFATGEPSRVAVVGLSQVGFGMLFDLLFWHRSFNLMTLMGIALIVAPTAGIMLRSQTWSLDSPPPPEPKPGEMVEPTDPADPAETAAAEPEPVAAKAPSATWSAGIQPGD